MYYIYDPETRTYLDGNGNWGHHREDAVEFPDKESAARIQRVQMDRGAVRWTEAKYEDELRFTLELTNNQMAMLQQAVGFTIKRRAIDPVGANEHLHYTDEAFRGMDQFLADKVKEAS